jgi:hypothetical protein
VNINDDNSATDWRHPHAVRYDVASGASLTFRELGAVTVGLTCVVGSSDGQRENVR